MTWTLEMDALDPGGDPVTLRFSLGRYDDPDDNAFDPSIEQPGHFKAGLFAGALIAGDRSSYGETTLINADGALNYLSDYAVDGRRVRVCRGTGAERTTVIDGTAKRLAFEPETISVVLRGPLEPLQSPHPQPVYAGDNELPDGLEGTADDIAGQAKPLAFGEVANATPVAVNTARLIYQVSARDDCEITAVYDNGADLERGSDYASLAALERDAPAAGEWRAYRGFVRLGASPVGAVTVDATTSAPGAGSVFAALAADRGWPVDAADVADLDALGPVRLYVTDSTSTLDLLDRIAVSVGGYLNLEPDGTLRCRRLRAPGGGAQRIEDYAIHDIKRSATGAGGDSLPVARVTLHADRLETTQDNVAGSVSPARRARLARQTRQAVAENTATRERHPLAGDLEIDSVLGSLASAQRVADELAAILGTRRDIVTVTARVEDLPALAVGEQRTVVTPRLGYGAGRTMLVTGYLINAQTGDIDVNLWG